MTTHELARKLLAGPNVMAVVRGYEGGKNEVSTASLGYIHKDEHQGQSYYGKHGECWETDPTLCQELTGFWAGDVQYGHIQVVELGGTNA